MVFLKSERLLLRNLEKKDGEVMVSYRNDPVCARYQRWEDTYPAAVARLIQDHGQDIFLSEKDEQHFAVCRGDRLVGDLSCFYTAKDQCVTLGITISPEHQRKGYAFEILSAVVQAVGERYPELDIVALIEPENEASVALFEKLGFYRECYAESIGSYVYVMDGVKK